MQESTPHLEISLWQAWWSMNSMMTSVLPLSGTHHESGVLRNPPVASPLRDGSQRFMVLDGANRNTALRKLNFPHVVVQVINPDA